MEEVLEKIKEAQLLANDLLARRDREDSSSQKGIEDWLEALRSQNAGSFKRPLVVLSLFDGIGGAWVALKRLGIPFKGYSSEINAFAERVVKVNFPDVKSIGNILHIKREHIKEESVDLIIGGFPCQDLTCIGKKAGLHGIQSRLFFDMLRIFHIFQPKWFLAENVATMTWADREEISKYIGIYPSEIDAQILTANKRKRYYWTNIPLPPSIPRHVEENYLDAHLDDATALEQKIGCIMRDNRYVSGNGAIQRVFDNKIKTLRTITVTELERLMGFPVGYTNVDFTGATAPNLGMAGNPESQRWNLLGNSFSIEVITHMLSQLLNPDSRDKHVKHKYSTKFIEKECQLMEPGEIWAMFNEYGLPTWYAVIEETHGDRFDCNYELKEKKKPLVVRVSWLDMLPAYPVQEKNGGNPTRGTGFYHKLESSNLQTSYLSFSHRVQTYKEIGDKIFIYPAVGEVWGIYDHQIERPDRGIIYVLLTEVYIDWNSLNPTTPGSESFHAKGYIMQRTVTMIDVFRCSNTQMELNSLSQFCFMAPFIYKGVANVLKMETHRVRKHFKRLHKPRQVKQTDAKKMRTKCDVKAAQVPEKKEKQTSEDDDSDDTSEEDTDSSDDDAVETFQMSNKEQQGRNTHLYKVLKV